MRVEKITCGSLLCLLASVAQANTNAIGSGKAWNATNQALPAGAGPRSVGASPSRQQYASGGHVLGFDGTGYFVSNGTYALRVSFENAQSIAPSAEDASEESSTDTKAPPLSRVSYTDVWPGISVTYDAPGSGIARSTWTLEPGADPAAIRLRYNRTVNLTGAGELGIAFDTGAMTESRPIAWQDVDGQRQPVEVAFAKLEDDAVGFRVGRYRADLPLTIDPTLTWNTFLGGSGRDEGVTIAVDGSGNVYVAGLSAASWGSPLRAYTASDDAFVAKLTSAGALTWNTFLGGSNVDYGFEIAVDGTGNVYVTGQSTDTWGSPVRPYTASDDMFVARLTSAGALTWNTFLGGSGSDVGKGIAVDGSGTVYVAGDSNATWGSPVLAYTSSVRDAFAAKLTSAGALTWSTFLGGSGQDTAAAIAVDGSGNAYVTGDSLATWGSPVRAHTLFSDAFAAKLDSAGALTWNTFLGSAGTDRGFAIAVDGGGDVYLAGFSSETWGSPVRSYTTGSGSDAFAAKLDSAGALTWNTFLGGAGADGGFAIAVDGSGYVYLAGYSQAAWGNPVRSYTAGSDAFAARLDSAGALSWNGFLGGSGSDIGNGIAIDGGGSIYVAGYSNATWGSPVAAYTSGNDAFAVQMPADMPTPTSTITQTHTPTSTPTISPTATPSHTPSSTPPPTDTPQPPTDTPTRTATSTPSTTAMPTHAATATQTPTATQTSTTIPTPVCGDTTVDLGEWCDDGNASFGDGCRPDCTLEVVAVAVGEDHTCALTSTGGVKCWGNNGWGQLGDGTTTSSTTPVDVIGLTSGVTAVAAGGSHTCALTAAGGVKCWGYNGLGQLGDGTTTNSTTPVDVGGLSSAVTAVATGRYHTCALTMPGGVKCWGQNGLGALGDGTTTNRGTPVDVVGLISGVTSVATGAHHTCALTGSGGIKCWGDNGGGQLGDGTTTNSTTPVDVNGLISGATAVSTGAIHSCALTVSGGAKCWGYNSEGQLGDGTAIQRLAPVDVSGLTSGVTAIAVGSVETCALTAVGGVNCWGYNYYGQLGDGTTTSRMTPGDVSGLASGVMQVETGSHTCALTAAGGVKCWGKNDYGQVGDGTTTAQQTTPLSVSGLSGVMTAVASGTSQTCARTEAGVVKCWGSGTLGGGTTPVDVSGLTSGVTAVAVGAQHACALTGAGGVKCWGYNGYGALGDGTTWPGWFPVDVSGLSSGATAVATGWYHTCALTAAGGVKCWGYNAYGQLGDGTTTDRTTPVDVFGLTGGVTAVAAGVEHTCAVTVAGGVKCWGRNFSGGLGDGTTTDRTTPVDVSGLSSGVTALSLGSFHSCALTGVGGVKCWGGNYSGNLGDGTTTSRLTPVDVSGLTGGATAVAAGAGGHTCALTASGGIKCWGLNTKGQLGDGTTAQQLTAVNVIGLTSGVIAVAAGYEYTCAVTASGDVLCWGSNTGGQLGGGNWPLTPRSTLGFSALQCGSGALDGTEQCDDGNDLGGDCCDGNCQHEAVSTPCSSDGNVCTLDQCDGAGTCAHPAGNAGTPCRGVAGPCDVVESCTGSDTACPSDGFATSGVCRPAGGGCDLAESCNGSSAQCPADGFATSGVCRPAAGECDLAESCNGSSAQCPADVFKASGTSCGSDSDPCTPDECGGAAASCAHGDADGDTVGDLCDNCVSAANLDQVNSDCNDPDYFLTAGCAAPPNNRAGCCDGGDVCDACPAQSDNATCDPQGTAGSSVGTAGGIIATLDGAVSVSVPPSALSSDTSITVTENGPATRFTLDSAAVFSVSMRPEDLRFNAPVTVTFNWEDRDSDGKVDRGTCVGGGDAGQSCDSDADCAANDCTSNTNTEGELFLVEN